MHSSSQKKSCCSDKNLNLLEKIILEHYDVPIQTAFYST